jgi:hypothetical protein
MKVNILPKPISTPERLWHRFAARINMHRVSTIFLTLLPMFMLCSCATSPGVRYSDVRGYAYNLNGGEFWSIIENGKLNKTAASKLGVSLTPLQVQRLTAALTGEHPDYPVALCFNPHHAFVFYDRANKARAWIDVCFHCSGIRSEGFAMSQNVDFPALAELCQELHLPSSPGPDYRRGFEESQKFARELFKAK